MKIHRTPHELSDLVAIDGDTIKGWMTYDEQVSIAVRIRLPGIEAGELDEPVGIVAREALQVILFQYRELNPRLACHPRVKDNHGRIVSDVLFGNGQSLCALLLASGRYWRRGARKPPDAIPNPRPTPE
jgi:endonuclease YncB( thermonuclease family)